MNEEYSKILEQLSKIDNIGVDISEDATAKQLYQEAKDARAEARRIERQFYKNEADNTSASYWKIVADHSINLLINYSRHIDVLVWLIESYCRIDGYEGIAFALAINKLMIDKFNVDLYPRNDMNDDNESHMHAMIGLNGDGNEGSLFQPLKNISIIEEPLLVLWQYQYLLLDHQNQINIGNEDLNYIQFMELVKESGLESLKSKKQSLESCIDLWSEISELLSTYYSNEVPTSQVKKSLSDALNDYNNIISELYGEACLYDEEEMISHEGETSTADTVYKNNSTKSRQECLHQLKEIARYFEVNEPQSPIPCMLHRVHEWANLSWADLMNTIIKNPDEMLNISEQTGMPHVTETNT